MNTNIKIWYTTNVITKYNMSGAEVVRHWSHPLTRGSVPVWAGLYTTAYRARCEAERALREAEYDQMERNTLCETWVQAQPDPEEEAQDEPERCEG